MKKIFLLLIMMVAMMAFGLSACGGGEAADSAENAETAEPAEEAESTESAEAAEEAETSESTQAGSGTLVVYFSATGTTKGVAEKIATITGGDIYEIKAAQEYTDEDLNWHDDNSRTTHEQNDPTVRPEIGSDPVSLDGYATIYIGYPIWWGEEPRIMDTFVESYNFDGITMIPFCTSGGSGVGRSDQNLEENAGSGNWLEGERLSGTVSEDELKSWIESLR